MMKGQQRQEQELASMWVEKRGMPRPGLRLWDASCPDWMVRRYFYKGLPMPRVQAGCCYWYYCCYWLCYSTWLQRSYDEVRILTSFWCSLVLGALTLSLK